jgi:hypothetical protein
MKVMKTTILLAAITALMTIGCAGGPKPVAVKADDIFANEENGILFVQNETGVDMVLLAGNVTRGIVLGGIRAKSSRNFDISKIENIPEEGAFIVSGVSEKIYLQRKGFISGDDVLYSGIVVFNLKNTKKIQKIIPDLMNVDTSTCIYVSNNSKAVCELRLNSPNGVAIAAIRPFEQNKKIWIEPSITGIPYMLFQNFIGYVNRDIINISETFGYRFNPVGQEGMIRIIEFDNRANQDMRIDLLFE